MPQPDHTNLHKELDLIQDVINRMAANSFQVKTWTMGIVTAVLAFKNEEIFSAGKTHGHQGVWISLVLLLPIVCFWLLDGFFLKTEKLYREIYKWVVDNRKFTTDLEYDLNTYKRRINYDPAANVATENDLKEEAGTIWDALYTTTLPLFYLIPALIVVSLAAYNWLSK